MESRNPSEVTIVGGGLVGSLLAVLLSRRGLDVAVYERRADPRRSAGDAGRSINLVVTSRGIRGLEKAGLERAALDLSVPVTGRMMHALDGTETFQPYGKDDSECNWSISRGELNRFLISAAEDCGVRFQFDAGLIDADLDRGRLSFDRDGTSFEIEAPVVFGADGAVSALRKAMIRRPGYRESMDFLEHGYKELLIPAKDTGGFRIEKNALHIWPRGAFMLMALPNRDGSFTVTLYLPHDGPVSFESLNTAEAFEVFFGEQFPDAVPLIPDLGRAYSANPTGKLGTVRCEPWSHAGRACLIGDAAHAIVPFFGQGMNCGFEDCSFLDELLGLEDEPDWAAIFSAYNRERKPDSDAIADMALENFVEMRDRVGDPRFLLRKQVEHLLEQRLPGEYRSRYSMVMYSQIPYRDAFDAGRIQQEILDELCRGLDDAEALDLEHARALIAARLTPLLRDRSIDLDY